MACYYYEDQDGFDVLSANLTNYHLKQAIKDFASLSTGDNGDPYHANIVWLERKAEPADQAKENLRSIHPFELRF